MEVVGEQPTPGGPIEWLVWNKRQPTQYPLEPVSTFLFRNLLSPSKLCMVKELFENSSPWGWIIFSKEIFRNLCLWFKGWAKSRLPLNMTPFLSCFKTFKSFSTCGIGNIRVRCLFAVQASEDASCRVGLKTNSAEKSASSQLARWRRPTVRTVGTHPRAWRGVPKLFASKQCENYTVIAHKMENVTE